MHRGIYHAPHPLHPFSLRRRGRGLRCQIKTQKMKKIAFFICIVITAIIGLSGCIKKEHYSNIPQIGFISFINVYDTGQYPVKGVLTISYQDGDGDIGLSALYNRPPFDTGSPYYYNLIITYYEKQQGTFKVVETAFPLSARMPLFTPGNPNEPIKGTIADSLDLNPHPVNDTVKFEAFIYDRALNKSNVITTPEIILRRH
jgi:hypothetical protein